MNNKIHYFSVVKTLTTLYLKHIMKSFVAQLILVVQVLFAIVFLIIFSTYPTHNKEAQITDTLWWHHAMKLITASNEKTLIENGILIVKKPIHFDPYSTYNELQNNFEKGTLKSIEINDGDKFTEPYRQIFQHAFNNNTMQKSPVNIFYIDGTLKQETLNYFHQYNIEVKTWPVGITKPFFKTDNSNERIVLWGKCIPNKKWDLYIFDDMNTVDRNNFVNIFRVGAKKPYDPILLKFSNGLPGFTAENTFDIEQSTAYGMNSILDKGPFFLLAIVSTMATFMGLSWDSLRREGALEPLAVTPLNVFWLLLSNGLAPSLYATLTISLIVIISSLICTIIGTHLPMVVYVLPIMGFTLAFAETQILFFQTNLFNNRYARMLFGPVLGLFEMSRLFSVISFFTSINESEAQNLIRSLYAIVFMLSLGIILLFLSTWRVGNKTRLALIPL
jgi:hypothetical protein